MTVLVEGDRKDTHYVTDTELNVHHASVINYLSGYSTALFIMGGKLSPRFGKKNIVKQIQRDMTLTSS